MFDRCCRELDYWLGVAQICRESPLVWTLTPNDDWPEGRSFGFHFTRDCLSVKTPCQFRPIQNTKGYRLTFPEAIPRPERHRLVLEGALWARLTAL